jgi:hypothetical protein
MTVTLLGYNFTYTGILRLTNSIRSEQLVVSRKYEMKWNIRPPAGRGGIQINSLSVEK